MRRAAVIALSAMMGSLAIAAPRTAVPVRIATPHLSVAGCAIAALHTITTIGSTVDPKNGDQNPYGLTIAPQSGGKIAAGDLVACNFNDALNIQGLGSSIVVLKPFVGAKPLHLIADPRLTGCAAIAMGGPAPWVAALDAPVGPSLCGGGEEPACVLRNQRWWQRRADRPRRAIYFR